MTLCDVRPYRWPLTRRPQVLPKAPPSSRPVGLSLYLPRRLGCARSASDPTRLAPAINGHTPSREVAVTIDIPFRYILAAEVAAVSWVLGAVVGVGVVLVRLWGERRGD